MKNILILITVILLSGCSLFQEKEELTTFKEKEVYVPVPVPQLPESPRSYDFEFLIVSPEKQHTIDKMQELLDQGIALYILTPKGYENLSLTDEEKNRFMQEQKSVIKYYIKATKPEKKDENDNANNADNSIGDDNK